MSIGDSSIPSRPPLRLVRPESRDEPQQRHDQSRRPGRDHRAAAYRQVARENQAASGAEFDPTDPRWVLAIRVAQSLEGAQLRPHKRERLLKLATNLGLRQFDANLIIALVQDRARRGELEMSFGSGLTRDMARDLRLIPTATQNDRGWWHSAWAGRAMLIALGLFWAFLILRWLLAGPGG